MATNTNRPNFYILLDLDPDAPWDQEAFERALSVKRSQWSRQTNGVGQRALEARKYLELLPQIRVVMQNPMQRNAEERVARVQQDEAYKKALEELEFRTAKGYITQDEIDELTRGFSLLAREKITKRIMVYIVNKPGQQPPNTIQPLAPELQQRIEIYLEALGKKDLYELLGLSSSASSAELVTAADWLYNEMVRRPASSETTTKKNLAGDAKGIFSSDETHQSYDASLRLKSPKSLKDALEKLARAVNSKPNKAVVAREIELYLDRTRKDGWEDGLALGWFLEEALKQQWTIQSFPKKQTNEAPTSSQTSSTGYRPSQHYQTPEYTQMQQQQPYNPYQQLFQNRQPPPSPPPYQQQPQYQTHSYSPPLNYEQAIAKQKRNKRMLLVGAIGGGVAGNEVAFRIALRIGVKGFSEIPELIFIVAGLFARAVFGATAGLIVGLISLAVIRKLSSIQALAYSGLKEVVILIIAGILSGSAVILSDPLLYYSGCLGALAVLSVTVVLGFLAGLLVARSVGKKY